jgi:hypothetical protein
MRTFLETFCSIDAAVRRTVLLETLERVAPGRVTVERTLWPAGGAAADTVNYTVTFGRQQSGLVQGAHYDAVPGSPGANDNGAAVTQLVFAAAALHETVSNGQPEPDCSFVFFDHEELFGSPYMGSGVWVDTHRAALPASALIWDVSGTGRLYVSDHDRTGLLGDLRTRETPPSDNLNFERAGVLTTLICALPDEQFRHPCPDVWRTLHSRKDSTDRVEDTTLEAGKLLALEAVARFMRVRAA